MIPTGLLDAVRMVVPCSAMVEVLGHKRLLGLGVVLVWLLLFHLLVNIWLLCIFTSLLVVLGGWLGSQAFLESNSVIHLERFKTLEQVPSSVEDEEHLDQEIHNTVRKIIRDFVSSWYSTVSTDRRFETEVQEAMVSMAMELKLRARQVDRQELTGKILDLFGSHLQDYVNAKELVKEQILLTADSRSESEQLLEAYFNNTSPHFAMSSASEEINYIRAMVDMLLHILVPTPHLKSRTGRFVVGELISCNVMKPLIDKLSNPDWLNILIVEMLGKSCSPLEMAATQPSTVCPPQAPTSPDQAVLPASTTVSQSSVVPQQGAEAEEISVDKMPIPEVPAFDVVDAEEVDFPTSNAETEETAQPFLKSFTRGRKSNPFYQEYDSDLDSPLAEDKQRSIDSLVIIDQEEIPDDKNKQSSTSPESRTGVDLEDVNASPVDGSCPKVVVNSEPTVPPNGCGSTADSASVSSSLQDVEREGSSSTLNPTQPELVLGGDQTVLGNPNELTVITPLHTCSPMGSFSFEPLSSPEGPVIIQNLRITGTITAKEHRGTGSHPYTLYTIKYETAMGFDTQGSSHSSSEDVDTGSTCCETTPSIHPVAYHMVNRRYSEFLNLQTRLEEKGDLRKLIKGVKGPKKVFPEMPFGNMDSDKIEARKGLLEAFLKQLCTMPEIANSEEMQEFLALNTDARIAFVKKPFIASRIDKFVVNAIVDTLKTAFPRSEPQSPTEDEVEVDGGKLSVDKKSRSRLRFSSKTISFMNGADTRPPVLFSLDQTNMVFKGATLEVLQTFISEQEKLSLGADADGECSTMQRVILSRKKREKCNTEYGSDTALAEVVLNILCLLMNEQWSWLCTENIQKTIRLLFGTLINRWLDVSVANMMSARYWTIYLRIIQEAVWPGGLFPKVPRPERSQQQKDDTKHRALHCLMRLLPDLVSDMLGSEKYKISWQIVLDSCQEKRINRHLVYCVFDLLLEALVPEIPEDAFQSSMLQTLCKNPEKVLA